MEAIFEIQRANVILKVYEDGVSFSRTGIQKLLAGSPGERKIYYKDISSIQWKKSNSLFSGLFGGTDNENRFTFWNRDLPTMEKIKEFVEKKINEKNGTPIPEAKSTTEQLRQLKQLLDEGILTKEEFEAKKKQLLGL